MQERLGSVPDADIARCIFQDQEHGNDALSSSISLVQQLGQHASTQHMHTLAPRMCLLVMHSPCVSVAHHHHFQSTKI
jgi:hypothetical protein